MYSVVSVVSASVISVVCVYNSTSGVKWVVTVVSIMCVVGCM